MRKLLTLTLFAYICKKAHFFSLCHMVDIEGVRVRCHFVELQTMTGEAQSPPFAAYNPFMHKLFGPVHFK